MNQSALFDFAPVPATYEDVYVRCRSCGELVGMARDAEGRKVYATILPGAWWSPESVKKCAAQKCGLICDCGQSPPHELVACAAFGTESRRTV